jgi:hypothetical protein
MSHPSSAEADDKARLIWTLRPFRSSCRNLPWPLAFAYLLDWLALTAVRERSATSLRAWLAGFTEGWRMDPGGRHPISVGTAWRMTRAGRPPVI